MNTYSMQYYFVKLSPTPKTSFYFYSLYFVPEVQLVCISMYWWLPLYIDSVIRFLITQSFVSSCIMTCVFLWVSGLSTDSLVHSVYRNQCEICVGTCQVFCFQPSRNVSKCYYTMQEICRCLC